MALSRPKRWAAACNVANEALSKLQSAVEEFGSAMEELKSIQEEYSEWRDNLPENLQRSSLYEKLDAVCDIDFESAGDIDLSSAEEAVNEAEGADLPLGFGRD